MHRRPMFAFLIQCAVQLFYKLALQSKEKNDSVTLVVLVAVHVKV